MVRGRGRLQLPIPIKNQPLNTCILSLQYAYRKTNSSAADEEIRSEEIMAYIILPRRCPRFFARSNVRGLRREKLLVRSIKWHVIFLPVDNWSTPRVYTYLSLVQGARCSYHWLEFFFFSQLLHTIFLLHLFGVTITFRCILLSRTKPVEQFFTRPCYSVNVYWNILLKLSTHTMSLIVLLFYMSYTSVFSRFCQTVRFMWGRRKLAVIHNNNTVLETTLRLH